MAADEPPTPPPRIPGAVAPSDAQVALPDLGDPVSGPGADGTQLRAISPKYYRKSSLKSDGSLMSSPVNVSWRIADQRELIDNEYVAAVEHVSTHRMERGADSPRGHHNGPRSSLTKRLSTRVVDWSAQMSKEKLKDTRDLIRALFWAFTDENEELRRRNSIASLSSVSASGSSRYQSFKASVTWLTRGEAFSGFYFILTVYALFGPDALLSGGYSPMNPEDITVAVINTIVFFCFVIEEVLNCWITVGYLWSGRFWVDSFATASIIGDTWFGLELVKSDAAVAGRGTRLVRLVRVGGRSSRLVRIFRVTRIMQVVKLVPKVERCFERDTHSLAYLLWEKRLRHVFRALDTDNSGRLSDEQSEFFDMAFFEEFKPIEPVSSQGLDMLTQGVTAVTEVAVNGVGGKLVQTAHRLAGQDERSFRPVANRFLRTGTGRRSFQRCVNDVLSMKESCSLVEMAISRLTLKCCVLVLVLLILTQLFASISPEEQVMDQGLVHLARAARDPSVSASSLCSSMVDEYSRVFSKGANPATLLLLIVDNRVWWDKGCQCCGASSASELVYVKDYNSVVAAAEAAEAGAGFEIHELYRPEWVVDGSVSMSVFDIHLQTRSDAQKSLLHTGLVVMILLALVVYFGTDMKRLANRTVLHPLWDLMDDMCALKSLDVLESSKDQTLRDSFVTPSQSMAVWARSSWAAMRAKCRHPIPMAEEMVQLRLTFNHLHKAMLEWSRFVPVALLKQLMRANVEAQIGCCHRDVTVFFCDVHHFQKLTKGLTAKDVLGLLDAVFSKVYEALEAHGGTMLEFIGDEVLAVFNAPAAVAGHQVKAMRAAVEARRLVASLRTDALPGRSVRLACSVHRATVLAGNLGAPTRLKYGVLGDGVNLGARLKSLNTRFDTGLLASQEALDFAGAEIMFVYRPIGQLILKGRTTPTLTLEVLGERASVPQPILDGAEAHQKGFELFCKRGFQEALEHLRQAHDLLSFSTPDQPFGAEDRPTRHLIELCEEYIGTPPPDDWDASEHLTQKAW